MTENQMNHDEEITLNENQEVSHPEASNHSTDEDVLTEAEVEIIPEDDKTEDSAEEIQAEAVDIQAYEDKIDQLEDHNLRLQAEIANMQRSNSRERSEAAKYRSQSLAKKLLDAIDNLERALAVKADNEEALAIHKGVEMVYQQILAAFKEEKIEVIDPLNEPFDPNFHQAVTTQPVQEGQQADHVVQVLQKGYILDDRIIRPAMVIVSA
ncbi:nucleotide exchange factor GrpE [Facklamia hominis]|uniref:nucleotide exchange factor GrpE n=1 Tax=Facklamia hominis TaxID=178214 RepID=UPI00101D7FB1|nr:nucleotide exchange factor GrpE [Facklamia hominis]RYC98887.1 nucleotide exchange factor GrpE [Facklamia hominis]